MGAAVAAVGDNGSGRTVGKGLQNGLRALTVRPNGSIHGGGYTGTVDPAAVEETPDNGARGKKTEQNSAQYKASNGFLPLCSIHADSSTSQWALPVAEYTVGISSAEDVYRNCQFVPDHHIYADGCFLRNRENHLAPQWSVRPTGVHFHQYSMDRCEYNPFSSEQAGDF